MKVLYVLLVVSQLMVLIAADCGPSEGPTSEVPYFTVNKAVGGAFAGGFNYTSDSALQPSTSSGSIVLTIPTGSQVSFLTSLANLSAGVDYQMKWSMMLGTGTDWANTDFLISTIISASGATTNLPASLFTTKGTYEMRFNMAANTATTVKSSGTATVATDLASGGWVQWVMIAYLDTTGKGYVYVYRDNEGPSRSVCAMVFNATGVYSQTGEAYKWGVGVGFAAATTADHSYLVGGIAAALLVVGVIVFGLIYYGNKRSQQDVIRRSGMTGSSQFQRLDEEVPSPLASSSSSTPPQYGMANVNGQVEEEELERWEESNLRPH